jgi:hypothetical protein
MGNTIMFTYQSIFNRMMDAQKCSQIKNVCPQKHYKLSQNRSGMELLPQTNGTVHKETRKKPKSLRPEASPTSMLEACATWPLSFHLGSTGFAFPVSLFHKNCKI